MCESKTYLWIDNEINTKGKFKPYERMFKWRFNNREDRDDQSIKTILKGSSFFTRAYIESPFFYLSLKLGNSFVIIQNIQRSNEVFMRFKNEEVNKPEEAGIKLLDLVYRQLSDMPDELI